ncbi:MAG TPA: penicillin-binding protein 2 [Candidatus Binatia bacterium]|jgi:cell division protein FtsI/penicillin-binding protein 2|nr:penicillin-binding protein 2 [Candidatus Binatia bacterium]
MSSWHRTTRPGRAAPKRPAGELRLRIFQGAVLLAMAAVAGRLFALQVLSHRFYAALASNQHGILEDLFPTRGAIYLRDPKSPDGRFPAAINKTLSTVYANDREIKDARAVAHELAPAIGLEEAALFEKLSKPLDPYEPLVKKADDALVDRVKALGIKGIGFTREQFRYYPEKSSVAHVVGFVASSGGSERVGRYGIEGHWQEALAGKPGALASDDGPLGRFIGSADAGFAPAKDGDDLTLTIDRNIQYVACEKLREAVARHGADSGSVVILDPKTGAVMAMCGVPDFDPNDFASADLRRFNNPVIFGAYEPGSVFKPVTMAAAVDAGRVGPGTLYNDEGFVKIGPYTIKNSDGKGHGMQTMTQVLEESLNTGTIFAVRQLGPKAFLQYVSDFGFGSPLGIDLDTESGGDIESLRKKGEIYAATASFGQGITVTPLQLAAAYGAIANGGKLMKPYVVGSVKHPDGTEEKTEPVVIRQVITKRAAGLVGGMLVRVVENGHGKKAAVPGYYVAGKTGTAQIPRPGGGYEVGASIGSFAGYAPVDDPAFVMAVRLDRPRDVEWAESSAGPLFGDIAKFLLQYLQIPPDRTK